MFYLVNVNRSFKGFKKYDEWEYTLICDKSHPHTSLVTHDLNLTY